jgi:hypothetical protein
MRRSGERNKPPPEPVIRDPLAVIPVVPPNIDRKLDGRGLCHLRRRLPLEGLRKKIAVRLGFDYSRELALDEEGTLYFRLVDGGRTLRDIAAEMVSESGRSRDDVERAVLFFTKTLMTAELIALRVTPESRSGGLDES